MEFVLHCGGALLITSCIGWLLLVVEVSGGDAGGTSVMLLAAAVTYAVSRALTRQHRSAAAGLLAAGAVAFAVLRIDVLYGRPVAAPLGYSNAAGSLYMLAAAAALVVAARERQPAVRLAAVSVALGCASVPYYNDTTAATVLVLLLPLTLLARRARTVRIVVAAGAAGVVLAALFTLFLTWLYHPGEPGPVPWVVQALSERRLMLWREALDFFWRNPVTGIGVLRFAEQSPTAVADPDTPWPHNQFLQVAAEAGALGLILFTGLWAWGFARLWWGAGDRGAAVAAGGFAAVGVHSTVDYVLHFPAVALFAAGLLGAGAAGGAGAHRRRERSGEKTGAAGPHLGQRARGDVHVP